MSAADARAAVRALRVGVAPTGHADILGVGQKGLRAALERDLKRHAEGAAVDAILVEGDWGSGKTLTLGLAKALCSQRGLATAEVTFNPRSTALSHPNRFYGAIALGLQVDGRRGLRPVVSGLLLDDDTRAAASGFAARLHSPFGAAIRDLCSAVDRGDRLLLERSWAWATLLGTDLAHRDDRGRKDAALRRIGDLAALLRVCGHGGLVLLGDEVESLGQLWNSVSRSAAYNSLGGLMLLPDVMLVLGAAGNFQRWIAYDLDCGLNASWRVDSRGREFFGRWSAGRFRRVAPPVLGVQDALELATIVGRLYEQAHGGLPEDAARRLEVIVRSWSHDPARTPRRLARLLVETLDDLREPEPV